MQDKYIVNEHIQGDPLAEENLETTLELVNKFRLLFPDKTIWLYTGYTWEDIIQYKTWFNKIMTIRSFEQDYHMSLRKQIIQNCNVLVDGQYMDSLRNIALKWCGSSNQKVIDVQQSLQKGEVVLRTE